MKRHSYFGLHAGLLALVPLIASAQPKQSETTNAWAKAEASMQEHLKGIDPNMRSAEFKSDRMQRYLPDYRVFVRFDRHMVGDSLLFLVNQDGKVTDLGEAVWRGEAGSSNLRVPRIPEFLRAQKIPIKTQEAAIEFVRFFEELQGAPNYVSFLKLNTRDFTVFDKRFIERFYGERTEWKYTSVKRDGGWTVRREYVGPPAMVQQPPVYEIDIDEVENFKDLRDSRGS